MSGGLFFGRSAQTFLKHLFRRMLLSTQFVECLFAQFGQWLLASKGLSIWAMGRKHVTHQYMVSFQSKIVDNMVSGMVRDASKSGKSRPAWVHMRKQTKSSNAAATFRGHHISRSKAAAASRGEVFDSNAALTSAHAAWSARSAAQKKSDQRESKRRTVMRSHMPNLLKRLIDGLLCDGGEEAKACSPWQFGDNTAPLSVAKVKEVLFDAKKGPADYSERWMQRTGHIIEPHPTFPSTVPWVPPCLEKHCRCLKQLRVDLPCYEVILDDLLYTLRLFLAPLGSAAAARLSNPTPLLKLQSICDKKDKKVLYMQVCSWRSGPFEFEAYKCNVPEPDVEPPFVAPMNVVTRFTRKVADLHTESELASSMASMASKWEYRLRPLQ